MKAFVHWGRGTRLIWRDATCPSHPIGGHTIDNVGTEEHRTHLGASAEVASGIVWPGTPRPYAKHRRGRMSATSQHD